MVPVGALLIDCNTKLTAASANAIAKAVDALGRPLGIRGVVRCLSIEEPDPNDLDYEEAAAILGAGMSLMAYQHPRFAGWHPTGPMGKVDGLHAGTNAMKAGLMPGTTIWWDLEGVAGGTQSTDVAACGNEWWGSVKTVGYDRGCYVGFDDILDAQQLYQMLAFKNYWSSFSLVPTPARRGFQMYQIWGGDARASGVVAGIPVDFDVCGRDWLGGGPNWMSP
jgi:Domain of unknown function (DUF1906)